MKLVYTLGFCALLFTSCKKTATSGPSSIQYKANGAQVQIVGGRDTSGRDIITGAYYGCYATKPSGSNIYAVYGSDKIHEVLIGILTTNNILLETDYGTSSLSVSFTIDGTGYGINNGDQLTMNISRFSNGTIDATFSGTISDIHSNKKVITDGHLNNIRVYY